MSDSLSKSNSLLEQLVAQIMKEKDPAKYDELAAQIWRVLSERECGAERPSSDETDPTTR